eukprot:97203_1
MFSTPVIYIFVSALYLLLLSTSIILLHGLLSNSTQNAIRNAIKTSVVCFLFSEIGISISYIMEGILDYLNAISNKHSFDMSIVTLLFNLHYFSLEIAVYVANISFGYFIKLKLENTYQH